MIIKKICEIYIKFYHMKYKYELVFLLLFIYSETCFPQLDTLIMMNGSKIAGTVLDTNLVGIKFGVKTKKNKQEDVIIDAHRLYSIIYRTGREKVVYTPDSTEENPFTVQEAKLFILGEQDATKAYKPKAAIAGGVAIGLIGGSVGTILALAPPFLYSGLMLIPKVKIKQNTVSNIKYLEYDAYLIGYERVARKKRLMRTFLGGMAGAGVGLLFHRFVVDGK